MNKANLTLKTNLAEPGLSHTGGLLIRRGGEGLDYRAWKRFVDSGLADPVLDNVLLNSWRRCARLGVDYTTDKQQGGLSPNNQFELDTLLELADRLDSKLLALMDERNLVFAITDALGRFVYRGGSSAAMIHTERLGFVIGADWTEGSVGTNAIGTALAEGFPVQIFGREHFRVSHQNSRCTAAPFYSPSGRIMGCVDLSSGLDADHSKNIELVIGISRFFERVLLQAHAREMQSWPAAMLNRMGLGNEGLIAVGLDWQICGVDDLASSILGRRAARLTGSFIDKYFDLSPIKKVLPHIRPGDNSLIALRTHKTPIITAQALPLWSPSGLWLGILLKLSNPAVGPRSSMSSAIQAMMARDDKRPLPAPPDASWVIVGVSEASDEVRRQAAAFAQTPSTVLIAGESGTGKELVARAIHAQGPHSSGPFVPVNCGAFPEDLIQSELFGYAPGAFTGADRKGRAGLFEQADGGVIFLDEVSELPLKQQTNLLRVLEEKKVTRVGGVQSRRLNVKVVAATNRDLARDVEHGRFRDDLFHRLNVLTITLPPLRCRREDILPIAEYHLSRLAVEFGLPSLTISEKTKQLLIENHWPGNIRGLINALEYACNLYFMKPFTELYPEHLPSALSKETASQVKTLECEAEESISRALDKFQGNISQAAKALGISRNTLYAKMRKLQVQRPVNSKK